MTMHTTMRRPGLWIVLVIAALGAVGRAASAQPVAPDLEPNLGWLNTDKPLRLDQELKGHVVVLDFWTYCCINCMHILPDLEALEAKYKDDPVVVVGVHSAKFENEGMPESIRNAIFRYRIAHPVVIDRGFAIWNRYGVRGWPSFAVVGADGRLVDLARPEEGRPAFTRSGEGNRERLDAAIRKALDKGKADGTLAAKRVAIKPDASVPSASGLAFPGKVLAFAPTHAKPGLVFIADSSHNRIIFATFDTDDSSRCRLRAIFGSGESDTAASLVDGDAAHARFNDPQGMAYDMGKQLLYVADTKNHAVRVVHIAGGEPYPVTTLVGNGTQSNDRIGGGAGGKQGLSSPWDLALTPDGKTLYVAMAGTHQLWAVDTETGVGSAIAGGDRENILDGPAKQAHLAQPSGLALATVANNADGTRRPTRLYFADSEVSAVRYLDLADNTISTVIGTGLFDFGDVDGTFPEARLQHCLGVTIIPRQDGKGSLDYSLLVADTYNHKIKLVHPETLSVEEWTGREREVNLDDAALALDEPGGIAYMATRNWEAGRVFIADTNNHRIVVVNPVDKSWKEVVIDGLGLPSSAEAGVAEPVKIEQAAVKAAPGKALTLSLTATLPTDGKLNMEAPVGVRVTRAPAPAAVGRGVTMVAQRTVRTQKWPITVEIPAEQVTVGAALRVELSFGWCTMGNTGVCRPGMVRWDVTIEKGEDSKAELRGGT